MPTQSWNFLWGLNVKHKQKHFIWKCLRGILPVNAVIKDRCLKGDHMCRGCGENVETIEHMLFFCEHVVSIWKAAPVSWEGLEDYRSKFWLLWEELKGAANQELGSERIALTINILWQIWKSRNERQFNGQGRNPLAVVTKAVEEWREFQDAQKEEIAIQGSSKGEGEVPNVWSLPQEGWIKINSDGALQQKKGLTGWGIVARDWTGKVLGAWAIPNSSCSNPKLEESMALRAAMVKAKQQGWRKVMFESDCLTVVEEINREQANGIGSVVLSDIMKLRTNFDKCCFTFTRRVNNYVSHKLAKMALNLREQTEWKDAFPVWLPELGQATVAGRCPSVL